VLDKAETSIVEDLLVFSIHPHHTAKIFAGVKLFEYRTRRPSLKVGESFLIYETRPTSAIVAQVVVSAIVDDCPCSVWAATGEFSGVTRDEFFDYFDKRSRAVAIGMIEAQRFAPVALPQGMTAPQAWARWKGPRWVTPPSL
jgi:predicted transcriptional regulator